jgi:hypothetical protein
VYFVSARRKSSGASSSPSLVWFKMSVHLFSARRRGALLFCLGCPVCRAYGSRRFGRPLISEVYPRRVWLSSPCAAAFTPAADMRLILISRKSCCCSGFCAVGRGGHSPRNPDSISPPSPYPLQKSAQEKTPSAPFTLSFRALAHAFHVSPPARSTSR